jgi:DNA modification methylase
MPAFWIENGWTIIGTVVRSKDRILEVGRKIEPNLQFLRTKKYRKPKEKREEGYYWVRMPNILSRSIPHESVHEGWEPARWDRTRWHLLGLADILKDSNLEAGHRIIPKVLQLLEEMLELEQKLLETQELGLSELKRWHRKSNSGSKLRKRRRKPSN